MTFVKLAVLGVFALMATAVCSAQQKFPLRSGEWTSTTPDPTGTGTPFVMLFCLNDDLWVKAFVHNPSCSLKNLNITSSGGSYDMDCPGKAFQMKGTIKMTFDGMTHMTATASLDMTANGKTTHTDSTSDWHWKGATCDASADINLRNLNRPH
jgi:hypothetical protein